MEVVSTKEEFLIRQGGILYNTNINMDLKPNQIGIFSPEPKLYKKTIVPLFSVYTGGPLSIFYKDLITTGLIKYNVGDVLGTLIILNKDNSYGS